MQVHPLSSKHLGELQLATERALQQWAKGIFAAPEILNAMERVLLFLRQNGGASKQARQVASLAFIVGEQVVQLGNWKWVSASDDGSLNPAILSPDQKRVCLVVDAFTLMLATELKTSVNALARACLDGLPHELVTEL